MISLEHHVDQANKLASKKYPFPFTTAGGYIEQFDVEVTYPQRVGIRPDTEVWWRYDTKKGHYVITSHGADHFDLSGVDNFRDFFS